MNRSNSIAHKARSGVEFVEKFGLDIVPHEALSWRHLGPARAAVAKSAARVVIDGTKHKVVSTSFFRWGVDVDEWCG